MEERWLPVIGYEGLYSVSDLGRVRGDARLVAHIRGGKKLRERIVRPRVNKATGYIAVNLARRGERKTFTVHALVAAAFLGPRPDGMEVAHGDGVRTNPALSNLRYATRVSNQGDKIKHGTHRSGERASKAKLTNDQVRSIRSDARLLREIAVDFGVSLTTVCMLRKGVYYRDAR